MYSDNSIKHFVYNFVSQEVFTLNEKVSAFCSSLDKLMIAIKSKNAEIKVFQICEKMKLLLSFPTYCSQINQIIYCDYGNYIASRGLTKENQACVYVYLNWWVSNRTRFRIAGKESISFFKKSSKIISEVVQIPVKPEFEILDIACCSKSGNIAISHGHLISLHYYFKIAKFKESSFLYYDFCHILNVSLSFFSTKLVLVENYLAFVSYKHIEVIKLLVDTEQASTIELSTSSKTEQSEEEFVEWNLNTDEAKNRILLPSLFAESENSKNVNPMVEITGPVDNNLLNPFAIKLQLMNDLFTPNIIRANYEILLHLDCSTTIVNLLLSPTYCESSDVLDPLTKNALNQEMTQVNPLLSSKYSNLNALTFFVSFQTKGYLYRIEPVIEKIDEYHYQNQMKSIIIENHFIYILNENNLKIFNNRSLYSHFGFQNTAWPSLLNSRPFFNAQILLNLTNHIILISQSELEVYTIYLLKRPSIDHIIEDMDIFLSDHVDCNQPTIDLFQNIIVLLRSQKQQNCCLSKARRKYLIKFSFQLVHQLIKELNCSYSDSINYVFEQDESQLQDLIDYSNHDLNFILNLLYLKSSQNLLINQKLKDFNLEVVKDIHLITKIILDIKFENIHYLSQFLDYLFDHYSSDDLFLIKLKTAFELNDFNKAQELLLNFKPENLLKQLLKYHNSFLPLNSFSEWILKHQTETFFSFIITCLKDLNYSIESVIKMLAKKELNLKILDLIYWSKQRTILSDKMIFKLLTLYFEAIKDWKKIKIVSTFFLPSQQFWLKSLSPNHEPQNLKCVCFDCIPIVLKLISILLSQEVNKSNFSEYMLQNLDQIKNVRIYRLFTMLLKPLSETIETMWDVNFNSLFEIAKFQNDPKNWRLMLIKASALNDQEKLDKILLQFSQLTDPKNFIKNIPKNIKSLSRLHIEKNYRRYQLKMLDEEINRYSHDI